jgi:hypothetical protein
MKENGKMIRDMDLEKKYLLINLLRREDGKKVFLKVDKYRYIYIYKYILK